jgi:hypothetical protein
MMDLDTFQDRLDSHGADLSRWPEAERAAAADLLARSAPARAALDGARRLENLLVQSLTRETAGADLRARLHALPERYPRPARRLFPPLAAAFSLPLPWRIGMAASVASLLVGLWLGASGIVAVPGTVTEPDITVDIAALAYGSAINLEDLP